MLCHSKVRPLIKTCVSFGFRIFTDIYIYENKAINAFLKYSDRFHLYIIEDHDELLSIYRVNIREKLISLTVNHVKSRAA